MTNISREYAAQVRARSRQLVDLSKTGGFRDPETRARNKAKKRKKKR